MSDNNSLSNSPRFRESDVVVVRRTDSKDTEVPWWIVDEVRWIQGVGYDYSLRDPRTDDMTVWGESHIDSYAADLRRQLEAMTKERNHLLDRLAHMLHTQGFFVYYPTVSQMRQVMGLDNKTE